MSSTLPTEVPPRHDRRFLDAVRRYRVPSARGLARRRRAIGLTKLAMPAVAIILLGSLALWPEYRRLTAHATAAAKILGQMHGDTAIDARYSSINQQGEPFTITADAAARVSGDRIDLTRPKGDITLQGGVWMMLQSKAGSYHQKANVLDLTDGVTLYRDDGTILRTPSASIDLRAGAAAGTLPVVATGPFGILHAEGGFTAADKGTQIFFAGPATLHLNGTAAR